MYMTTGVNGAIGIILGIGFYTSLRLGVGYIYMLEMLPTRAQTRFATAWCVFEASIMLWITLYFINSAARDWVTISMVGYVMQVVALVGVFFIPESPKFLLEQHRLKELSNCLQYIAKWNGKQIDLNFGGIRTYSDVSANSNQS